MWINCYDDCGCPHAHCNTLQRKCPHAQCNTLQHTATRSIVMMTVSALTHTATHYTTLQHIGAHCNRMHCYNDCECPHAAREHILSRKHTPTHLRTQLLFLSRTHAHTRCACTHTLFHTHTHTNAHTGERTYMCTRREDQHNRENTKRNSLQHTATHCNALQHTKNSLKIFQDILIIVRTVHNRENTHELIEALVS